MGATLTWLGHASIRLTLPDKRVILIDPWLTENPSCPDALKNPSRCDLILLTHGHFDHIGDVESLIMKFDPMIVANLELCSALEKTIGTGRFGGMNTGGTQNVDGVQVSLTQAFHSSSVDTPDGPMYAGMPNGLVINVDGLASIYNAGDTDVFNDMMLIAKLFSPDICILPIGDFFTMGSRGAALAAQMLQPKSIVPVHYKTFPILDQSADDFRDALSDELKRRLFVPEVGQIVPWNADGLGG